MAGKISSTEFSFPVTFEVAIPASTAAPTFEQIQPQSSINDRLGWIVHRAEFFHPTEVWAAWLDSTADFTLEYGIANSNSFAVPTASNPALKIRQRLVTNNNGAAAATTTHVYDQQPFVQDFSTLPGGGMLMLPYPMYGYVSVIGTLPAGIAGVNCYFTLKVSQVQLSDADFFALLQANQMFISQ